MHDYANGYIQFVVDVAAFYGNIIKGIKFVYILKLLIKFITHSNRNNKNKLRNFKNFEFRPQNTKAAT